MQIWAQSLVRNEERYVWFSIMSVINYVDKFMIWDTGSDDHTCEIIQAIKKIYPDKVEFKEFGKVDSSKFTSVRQRMLVETKSDWFIIVDGDEVWWDDSIKNVVNTLYKRGENLDSIISPYFSIVGDIYHYQPRETGRYKIDKYFGHFNIRATNRKINGLKFTKPHGQLALIDKNDVVIQERPEKYRKFVKGGYLHFTNLPRSNSQKNDSNVIKRKQKLKYEFGLTFPSDFFYPEVFFRAYPQIVPSPWTKRSKSFEMKAILQTPLKYLKRKIIGYGKTGY